MALQVSASDTLWLQDGTDQLIDRAIGIADAACGIGLSLKNLGWVAGVQDLGPVGCCRMSSPSDGPSIIEAPRPPGVSLRKRKSSTFCDL